MSEKNDLKLKDLFLINKQSDNSQSVLNRVKNFLSKASTSDQLTVNPTEKTDGFLFLKYYLIVLFLGEMVTIIPLEINEDDNVSESSSKKDENDYYDLKNDNVKYFDLILKYFLNFQVETDSAVEFEIHLVPEEEILTKKKPLIEVVDKNDKQND